MSDSQSYNDLKMIFYEKFNELLKNKKENCFSFTEDQYNKTLNEVREAKEKKIQNEKLTSLEKRRLNRYDIAFDKLVAKNSGIYKIFYV